MGFTIQLKDIKWNTEGKYQDTTVCFCQKKKNITFKETLRIFPFHTNGSQMQGALALLIFAKADFKPQRTRHDKEITTYW